MSYCEKNKEKKCKFKGHDRTSAIGLSNHRMGVYSLEKYFKYNCNQQFTLMIKYFTLSWWTGGWEHSQLLVRIGQIFNVVNLIQWVLKGRIQIPPQAKYQQQCSTYVQLKLSSRSISNFSSLRAAAIFA